MFKAAGYPASQHQQHQHASKERAEPHAAVHETICLHLSHAIDGTLLISSLGDLSGHVFNRKFVVAQEFADMLGLSTSLTLDKRVCEDPENHETPN